MKRVIRKFDDFVKSKSINEDNDPMVTPDLIENEEGFESTERSQEEDDSNLIDSKEDVMPSGSDEEEEEESGEYYGTVLLKKLADMLGADIKDNEIDYNGQKIHFYSETEMFHVGKNKFKTPEEVVEFLKPKEEEEVVESNRFSRRPNSPMRRRNRRNR